MNDLLDQIEDAIMTNKYYLALFTALTIPDICAAMGSENGLATKEKYIQWFNQYVAHKYQIRGTPTIDGETCYTYRCAALHQGRAEHPKLGYAKILFIEPGATTNVVHNNIIGDALNIDVSTFCNDIISSARTWLSDVENTDNFQKNFPKFLQRYPNGLSPYIGGVPVIA